MTPSERGRHCDKCDLDVVDFSRMSDAEAASFVMRAWPKRVCGRLRSATLAATILVSAGCAPTTPVASGHAIAAPRSENPDRDGDSIPNEKDQRPDAPEDKDGFEDEDGCPDPDNDKDLILDNVDRCPNERETYNGMDDEDGCPDKPLGVVIANTVVQILSRVEFKKGNADVPPSALTVLDEVARVLRANPDLTELEVRGHAIHERSGAIALKRATAVVEALVKLGVERGRLKVVDTPKAEALAEYTDLLRTLEERDAEAENAIRRLSQRSELSRALARRDRSSCGDHTNAPRSEAAAY